MPHIVVYDKKSQDAPVVSIHPAPNSATQVALQDIYPFADPERYGLVVVADDVVEKMTAREYKLDRKGNVSMQPVLEDRTKPLLGVMDSALGQNIVLFGEAYLTIKSVTDVAGNAVSALVVDATKGIVGLGSHSGYFNVTCTVDTGRAVPELSAERKNWQWTRDARGNVAGMKLLK